MYHKKIVVGCPALRREWILPLWKEYLDAAIPDDFEVEYVFSIPKWDKATLDSVFDFSDADKVAVMPSDEPEREDFRNWADTDSYTHMSNLRNDILRQVRAIKPDYYLSLDSDILINPDAITGMIELMDSSSADAVGGLAYLDAVDKTCTNAAVWKTPHIHNSFRRVQPGATCPVDTIMAVKLMNNLAYNVNYEHHQMGEDFGWSLAAKRASCKLVFDGRYGSKHIMSPFWLDHIDPRVGY